VESILIQNLKKMEKIDIQTQKSFDYISENLNVSFDEIPMELINYWIIDDPNSLLDSNFELDEDSHQFTVLSMRKLHEITDLKFDKFKLFGFKNYDSFNLVLKGSSLLT
jgi:hypothetical protein